MLPFEAARQTLAKDAKDANNFGKKKQQLCPQFLIFLQNYISFVSSRLLHSWLLTHTCLAHAFLSRSTSDIIRPHHHAALIVLSAVFATAYWDEVVLAWVGNRPRFDRPMKYEANGSKWSDLVGQGWGCRSWS